MSVNINEINMMALERLDELLPRWLPEGRFDDGQFRAGSLDGEAGEALVVDVGTGSWCDLKEAREGDDPLSLLAAVHGLEPGPEAVEELTRELAELPPRREPGQEEAPVPEGDAGRGQKPAGLVVTTGHDLLRMEKILFLCLPLKKH